MFGGGFQGHGHHGHGHHGHHHGHHHDNHNQGFNQNQWGQHMSWSPMPGAQYKLVSGLASNMVLDMAQNPHQQNHHLILWEYHGGHNQRFYFQSIGGNKFGIFNAKSHQTVEVPQGSQNNGTRIVCSQPNKQVNEFWELIPANFMGKPNAFYIKSFCGKALDVSGGQAQNGTHIIQWDYNGNSNQIWVIEQC